MRAQPIIPVDRARAAAMRPISAKSPRPDARPEDRPGSLHDVLVHHRGVVLDAGPDVGPRLVHRLGASQQADDTRMIERISTILSEPVRTVEFLGCTGRGVGSIAFVASTIGSHPLVGEGPRRCATTFGGRFFSGSVGIDRLPDGRFYKVGARTYTALVPTMFGC